MSIPIMSFSSTLVHPDDLSFVPLPGGAHSDPRTVLEDADGGYIATVPGLWSREEHAKAFAHLINAIYHRGLQDGRQVLKARFHELMKLS